MTSLRFNTRVLEPIPQAGPGRSPLQRRASAPELAVLDTIYNNANKPYQVGDCIRLRLPSNPTTQSNRAVTARIVKAFAPFSMAPVMVVRISEPLMDLEGDFVLKVYDNRCSDQLRQQYKVERWNRARDMILEKRRWSKHLVRFFHKIMADDYLYAGEDGEENDTLDSDETDEDKHGVANDELFLQAVCLKMYRAELEVYRQARCHSIDGTDVPRFISSVRIPPSYHSKNSHVESANIKGIPGILIQYLPGFPMSALYELESPVPPRSAWQHIIDDGVRIVHYVTTKMCFRNTDCCPRNTVVHWDPIKQSWKCKLIDFGHCVIRKAGMSDWGWREDQAWEDEEGGIGLYMKSRMLNLKSFDCVYERSQYFLDLSRDFLRET